MMKLRYALIPIVLGGGSAALAATPQPAPEAASLRLEVDISDRMLTVHHGGEVKGRYSVAVGQDEHPTPEGDFSIERIIWNPAWVPPNVEWAEDETRKEPGDPDNPMQGAKLFFKYPDYYIHGTTAPESLGGAASHGCIRMEPEDVKRLGELVQEHAGEPRDEAWYRRVQRDDDSKHEVSLPDPIPISIHP